MNYILQIHTGSFDRLSTDIDVGAALSDLLCQIPAEAVIFGWNKDRNTNEQIIATAKRHHAKTYFWLPVFSENTFPKPFVPCGSDVNAVGHGDESFSFCCVSSPENVETAYQTFQSMSAHLDVDGVFLDRIRYPSPANGLSMFKGCFCAHCRELYRTSGIDTAWLEQLTIADSSSAFSPASAAAFRYLVSDNSAQSLMTFKRRVITQQVSHLIDTLRRDGYAIGLDLFDPALADFVGQDIPALVQKADFSKPMTYRVTTAPAGIPFELQAIRHNIGEQVYQGIQAINQADLTDLRSCTNRLTEMNRFGTVYPGIEVNAVDSICNSTPQSIADGLEMAEKAGCKGVVLSWNMLNAPPQHLHTIQQLNRV